MKNLRRIFLLKIIIALVFSMPGYAQEIDIGEFDGTTYSNPTFGLTISLPAKWYVMDANGRKMILAKGKKMLDSRMAGKIDTKSLSNFFLLSVFRYPPDTKEKFNPSFAGFIESIKGHPDITPRDYLIELKKGLSQVKKIKYEFVKDIYNQKVDGKEFWVLETEASKNNKSLNQKYYALVKNDYALCFILTFREKDSEDKKKLEEIITNMKIE